ncbi:MAG: 2-dehydropantoate 2-reductase [Bacillota bacterium]
MKIAIIGAGAMGSLFGGLLCKSGNEVWFVDVWQEHINAIKERGLKMCGDKGDFVVTPRATTKASEAGRVDLIILFVKGFHTEEAMQSVLDIIDENTAVLTLQNGLGNVEIIEKFIDRKHILFGMTTLTSDLEGPGKIFMSFAGEGETTIQPAGERWEDAQCVSDVFNKAGLCTVVTENVKQHIWEKLVVNCNYNTYCALLGLSVGQLIDCYASRSLLVATTEEISAVASAAGFNLPYYRAWEHLMEVGEEARAHYPSMVIDIRHKRQTEIDFLNGAVVREGKKQGIPTPVNETAVTLIKTLESTYHHRK